MFSNIFNCVMVCLCTAYTASADECGKADGITASGVPARAGVTVAADHLPLGTRIRIDGKEYIVQDRFGGGHKNKIDIFMDSKSDAYAFGKQWCFVEIINE